MSTLERAIEIAAAAHAGQVDKAGQPYILHPLRVMLRVSTEHERMAAALHDVVEDTSVTLEALAAEGFSPEVLEAVRALTKFKGETRMAAAMRAAANPIARAVKLADNAENMDLSRIANPTERDYARLKEYEEVRALLLAHHGAARLFHIASAADWAAARGTYAPSQLSVEGFVHCSTSHQVLKVAGAKFAGRTDLVLLCIDPGRVRAQIRYENLEGGTELFPHVYGALELAAVVSWEPLRVGGDGQFVLPDVVR